MKNDTETKIVITMRNVDHASALKKALNKFFSISDMGGDCHLRHGDGYSKPTDCGLIGHDVRKAKVEHITRPLSWYLKDKYGWPIEFQIGKGRAIRIICQNIRKVTG